MPFGRGNDVNKAGKARHGDRLSSSDAGAPAPTPRSPHARRFRRHRSLGSHRHHRGALEPATAAATAASDAAMATDASHATVRLPAPPAPPAGKPPPQLPPSRFCAPMRTARPHASTACSRLRCGAGCRCEFGRTDRVDLAAACDAGLAAACLPLHPPRASARARSTRPSTRPLSAVRRCRHGCERQR